MTGTKLELVLFNRQNLEDQVPTNYNWKLGIHEKIQSDQLSADNVIQIYQLSGKRSKVSYTERAKAEPLAKKLKTANRS